MLKAWTCLWSQRQDTYGDPESLKKANRIFIWRVLSGFSQKKCPDIMSAGAGVESKIKGSSCLPGDGISEAVR